MADISMDNVNIEIESSSEKASQGVATLVESLTNLNSKLSSVQNNATKYAKNIQNVGNILKSIKMPKLPKISDIFKKNKPTQENPLQDMHLNNNQKNGGDDNNGKKSKKSKKDISEVNKTAQELSRILASTTSRIKDMLKHLGKIVVMKVGLKGLNAIFGGIGSKISTLSSGFKTLAKNLSKYSLALFGIRSAFYAVRNTSNEFLSSQDAVAKQLSTNISYLKFAIGSAFAPVIEYITNLIYKLLQAIQALVYYFAKINIFAGKTAKSYAGMGASAAKATKEANKQLQAFDELNNINLDKNDGGGGGGAGGITPSFDLSNVREDLLPKFDNIESLFAELAHKINNALASINWDSVIEKTTNATRKIANALNAFTKELDFKLIGYTIAQGLNTITANLNTFFDTYDFNVLGSKLGEGINSIIYNIKWEDLGKSMTNGFRAMIDVLYNVVTTVEWDTLGQKIGTAIKSAFANIDWKKTGETIYRGVTGILDTIINALDSMDIDAIAKDLGDMLSQIDFGEIFKKVLTIAVKAIEGLGKILWQSIFSGDGDLAKVLFLIIDIVAIKKVFGLLFSTIGEKVKTGLVSGFKSAKSEGSGLTNTLNGVSKSSGTLKTGLNNLISSLGKAAQAIAVLGGLRLVIDGITNLLKVFGETGLSVGDALGFLGGAIGIITIAFGAMMAIMKALEPSWQSIAGAAVILGGFALVINQVANLLNVFAQSGLNVNEVIGIMLAIFTPIVALMGVVALLGPEMTAGLIPFLAIVAGIDSILLTMSITLPIILDAAGKFIQTIAPSVIQLIKAIYEGIVQIIEALGKILPPIIEAVGKVFEKVFDGISKVAKTVGEAITNIFKEAGNAFEKIFNGIGNVAKNIGDSISNVFRSVGDSLSKIFDSIGSSFERIFNGIGNVARAIGQVITSIFNGISQVVQTVGNVMERVLRSIGWLIENTLNSLLRFAWEIGPAIENSINAILRSVTRLINFIVSGLEFLVNNTVIAAINGIISAINALPMMNISKVPQKHLPRFYGYEDGGYPKEGDFFFANENGPEMIGTIGNRTAVANNDQITKAIADATYTAFVQALGENSGNDNQPLNIYIGNDKVYKGYTKQQSQMSNQYGVVI